MVTDAVLTVKRPGKPLDLLMIEQMEMITKDAMDSKLVRGLVCVNELHYLFIHKISRHYVYYLCCPGLFTV